MCFERSTIVIILINSRMNNNSTMLDLFCNKCLKNHVHLYKYSFLYLVTDEHVFLDVIFIVCAYLRVLVECIENKQRFEIVSEQINVLLFAQVKRILRITQRSTFLWKSWNISIYITAKVQRNDEYPSNTGSNI